MKKFIIVTMIAACAALCAAVWLHDSVAEENTRPGRRKRCERQGSDRCGN